jgi:acetoacetyl-CoA synthetase
VVDEGDLLWSPSDSRVEESRLHQFTEWLAATRALRFESYDDLRRWSVEDLEAFW